MKLEMIVGTSFAATREAFFVVKTQGDTWKPFSLELEHLTISECAWVKILMVASAEGVRSHQAKLTSSHCTSSAFLLFEGRTRTRHRLWPTRSVGIAPWWSWWRCTARLSLGRAVRAKYCFHEIDNKRKTGLVLEISGKLDP